MRLVHVGKPTDVPVQLLVGDRLGLARLILLPNKSSLIPLGRQMAIDAILGHVQGASRIKIYNPMIEIAVDRFFVWRPPIESLANFGPKLLGISNGGSVLLLVFG
jgi:hypothetical protein